MQRIKANARGKIVVVAPDLEGSFRRHFGRDAMKRIRRPAGWVERRGFAHPDNPNGHPIDPSWYKDGRTS